MDQPANSSAMSQPSPIPMPVLEQSRIPPAQISSEQVWGALTPVQQQGVFRTIVWVCRSLVNSPERGASEREARHEPA